MASPAPSGPAAVPTVPERRQPGKNTLPDQRTLLTWLFVGRLVLATGVLLGAGLVWTERPQESFIVSVAVVFALVFTGYGAGTVFLLRRAPTNTFFLIQALVDLGLVTTIVHFVGQPQSAFPALYVLVVAAYSLLMPPAWVGLSACWGTDCARPVWSRPPWPQSSSGSGSRPMTSSGTSDRGC